MQYEENIRVALRALIDHKFRSFLTMLGIIFGVASVITMLSIGEGAKREAIAKYQDLGVNNIIIREKKLSARAQFKKYFERMKENLQVDDFEINEDDMGKLNSLPYIGGSGLDSDTIELFN